MSRHQRTLSIRLEQGELSFLRDLAQERHQSLSETVRHLLSQGRVLLAVDHYRHGTLSLECAARLAGLSMSALMELLDQLGIKNPLPLADYLQGIEHLRQAR